MSNFCQVQWLGRMSYEAVLQLQRELVLQRSADEIPDTLLLLEHPATFSLGIDAHREHLLISEQELARLNISYHTVDRSGSVTYHCPGQLIAYPILKLTEKNYNYHTYIEMLENVIIRTLASFKVRGFRQQGQRGIWIFARNLSSSGQLGYAESAAKIASVGVNVNRHNVTSHGFWINVNPNMQFFDLIVPTDVREGCMTSLQQILDDPKEIGDVIEPVIQSFCQIFEIEPMSLETSASSNYNLVSKTPI